MTNWTWRPTVKQREIFEEWKQFCFGYLVSSKEGINAHRFPDLLSVHVGETFPLEEMGFRSGNQFLYQLEDYIDVRKVEDGSGRLFVFIKENRVPSNLHHIRDLVLRQREEKERYCVCQRTGRVLRPRRNQTVHCNPQELLIRRYVPRLDGDGTGTEEHSFSLRPSSNFSPKSGLVSRKSWNGSSGITTRHFPYPATTSTRNIKSRLGDSTGTATNGATPNKIMSKPISLMKSFTRPTTAPRRYSLDLDFDPSEDDYLNGIDFFSGGGTFDRVCPESYAGITITVPNSPAPTGGENRASTAVNGTLSAEYSERCVLDINSSDDDHDYDDESE